MSKKFALDDALSFLPFPYKSQLFSFLYLNPKKTQVPTSFISLINLSFLILLCFLSAFQFRGEIHSSMEEELQESDIIWSDNHYYHCSNITKNNSDTKEVIIDESSSSSHSGLDDVKHNKKNNNKKKKTMSSNSNSHPINIPSSLPGYNSWSTDSYESYHFDDEDEMIPPHLMAARRLAQNTGFSVCTGTGRTLKGRDLSQVRNSILRMTGFLET